VAIPVTIWFLVITKDRQAWPMLIFGVVVMLLVVLRHQANIQRLCKGTETRFIKKT